MAKLRKSIQKEIIQRLENGAFPLSSYQIEFGELDSDMVRITFRPYPEYCFRILEKDFATATRAMDVFSGNPPEPDIRLCTVEAPHKFKNSELSKHRSIESCLEVITEWIKAVDEELDADTFISEKKIDDIFDSELIEQIDEIPHAERFTTQDVIDMERKLSEVEAKLKQQIKENEANQEKIDDLEQLIQELKGNLKRYPKKTWYTIALDRLQNFTRTKLKSETVKSLLIEGTKELVKEGVKTIFK